MTPEQIKEVLAQHGLWLDTNNGREGKIACLAGVNLSGADLAGANLINSNLSGANLSGASLAGARLAGVNLSGANLSGANLQGANLQGGNLVGADLLRANLSGGDLMGANLINANLYGANLVGADLRRANLSLTNLSEASLVGVNLWSTIGNMKEIKSLQIDTYSITYTFDRLQIGCKNHSIEEWKGFSDKAIEKMDRKALEWWKKHRDIIFQIIDLSPATPPGHEGQY